MEDELQHCRTMIADQERLAAEAGSPEAAEVHRQLARLYEAQLGRLSRRGEPRPSEPAKRRTFLGHVLHDTVPIMA